MNVDLTVYEALIMVELLQNAMNQEDKFGSSDLETIIYKLEKATEELNKE